MLLNLEISRKINDLTLGLLELKEFEVWLFEDSSLENQFETDLYIDLVSIDYSKRESKYEVQKLTEGYIDLASLHKLEILETLKLISQHEGNAWNLILKLYNYADKGYYFLAENNLIGNYGEQGKSIGLSLNNIEKNDYWALISEQDSTFFSWITTIIYKIENGRIVLTNEIHVGDYGQISYNFEEN